MDEIVETFADPRQAEASARVGDIVLLRAKVYEFLRSVNVAIELSSLAGDYIAYVREARIAGYGAEDLVLPGDLVEVRATVVSVRTVVLGDRTETEFEVELFSKTEQYRIFVSSRYLGALVLPILPDEPGAGAWVVGVSADDGDLNVWHRDDENGPDRVNTESRRFPRHWFNVATRSWEGWATAVCSGADPGRALTTSSNS